MRTNPFGEGSFAQAVVGNSDKRHVLFDVRGRDIGSVKFQGRAANDVGRTFVTVDERMILDDAEGVRRGQCRHIWFRIAVGEQILRPRDCGR
jgi:hypothetical protein